MFFSPGQFFTAKPPGRQEEFFSQRRKAEFEGKRRKIALAFFLGVFAPWRFCGVSVLLLYALAVEIFEDGFSSDVS